MLKFKGIVGSVAPQLASAGLVALGVVAFSGSAALAGSCSTTDNINFTCEDPAGAPGTDTPISIDNPGTTTVTTDQGFGIDANGTAITITGSGTGDISFTDTNASAITGTGHGIYMYGANAGAIGVATNGVITAGSTGILATMGGNSAGLTIDVNDINADGYGISFSGNAGTGDVSITAHDIASGSNGIHFDNGPQTHDFTVDVNKITSTNANGIYGFSSGTGDTNITVHDSITAGTNGIWIDIDPSLAAGATTIDVGNIYAGNEGINLEANANTTDLTIKVNDVTSGASGIRFNTWGSGDVSVTANDIDSGFIGIWLDTDWTTKDLTIDVNSITAGDDGINAFHSGDGTVNITVRDSIVSGDDGIEFYADNAAVGKVNITVNDVKGRDNGVYVGTSSAALADQTLNDLNVTTTGHIEAGDGWGIWTQTNDNVLTNITVKNGSVIESASGHAIGNYIGDSHVIIENAIEIVDDPNTVEVEKNSVNGRVLLGLGGDRLDLHGGFSGITEVNGGYGGTNSDDILNLYDANSTYNANNIVGWDVFNVSNSYLTLDGPLGNLYVGTAGVAGTGIFLTNGSTLESNQHGLNIWGNLTLDAGTTFLSDVNDDAGNPGRGDTYITGFLTNGGTISIADGAADDDLKVNGLYTGNNGTLVVDTVLGGDTSATDTMTFLGGTAVGNTSVVVNNIGGTGAQTVEGIKIINVSGASDGAFSLVGDYEIAGQQAVLGGAYGYTLWKNGISTPDDGDWYLRSQLAPTGSNPGGLLYQPGAPVFEAYAGVLLGLNSLSTLQQRVGNRSWSGGAVDTDSKLAGEPLSSIEGRGIWGRIEAAHTSIDPAVSTTGSNYDFDTLKFQAGVDFSVLENESGKLIGAVTGHYGHASADISSSFGNGSISTDGAGFGGTLTWYGNSGFYVDGQAQVSWYDSDLGSDVLGNLASGNDGTGYALSLETGKRIGLDNGLSLTPQAQLVYSSVDFDSFTQTYEGRDIAAVSLLNNDSLRGRLGMSLDQNESWRGENGLVSRSHIYGIANLYYEFLDGTSVDVSGATLASRDDRFWGGVGLGGSYDWNDDKYSIYGEGSINTSLQNVADSYDLKGTAGFRVKW
ncbi:autotransporter outer membrane beta-barrel domain-containing protein [Kaistia granuli]|uniref:autotransporter outer membrane beta-barrel domain-containing protein n=1 Tax=Kaistia granuli TaxID=363259 RepID=UPI00035E5BB6|nr:autotransporter outer membrane beta-barrel domain-containing protein [Kaistia granuli]